MLMPHGDWRVTEVTDEEDEWAYNDTEKEFKRAQGCQESYGREAYPTDITNGILNRLI